MARAKTAEKEKDIETTRGQEPLGVQETAEPSNKIGVRVNRIFDNPNSTIKANMSINIGGEFAVHGITVRDGKKGLYVSMPSTSYTDSYGEVKYKDTFHPVTAEARSELYDTIMGVYNHRLEEIQAEAQGQERNEISADNDLFDDEDEEENHSVSM